MKITVTAENIAQGEPQDASFCAVALAIGNCVSESVYVYGAMCQIGEVFVGLADDVQEWIAAFDMGLPVYPFEFELAYKPTSEPCVNV